MLSFYNSISSLDEARIYKDFLHQVWSVSILCQGKIQSELSLETFIDGESAAFFSNLISDFIVWCLNLLLVTCLT